MTEPGLALNLEMPPPDGQPPTGARAARAVFWVAIARYGQHAVTFLAFIALSRLLPPEAFGLLAMGMVFTTLVEELIELGMGPALVQLPDLDPLHVDTALTMNVVLGVLFAAGGWILAGPVAGLFHQPALAPVVRFLSLGFIPAGVVITQEAVLRRNLRFRVLTVRTLVASGVSSAAAIACAALGAGVWSMVVLQVSRRVVGPVVLWRATGWRPHLRFSWHHLKELLGVGSYMFGSRLLVWASMRSDDLLVGMFLGSRDLGFYSLGYRAYTLLTEMLTGVMNSVVFPVLSSIQREPARFLRAFGTATRVHVMVVLPVFVWTAVFGADLVQWLMGEQWIRAGQVLGVLAWAGVVQALTAVNGGALMALGHARWMFRIGVVSTLINVIGFVLAVRWGITAVAAAFVARAYLSMPLSFWVLRRTTHLDLPRHLRHLAGPVLAAMGASLVTVAVVGAAGLWWPSPPFPRLVLSLITGGLAYGAILRLLVPAGTVELIAWIRRAWPRFGRAVQLAGDEAPGA